MRQSDRNRFTLSPSLLPPIIESPGVGVSRPSGVIMRASALCGVGLLLCGWTILGAEDPPRDWIEPATGHRVVRLSERPGTASLYLHQNPYTASGDMMVVSTPEGLATIALATRKITPLVEGRASHLVVGRKTRQAFYIQNDTVYAADLRTRVTRKILSHPRLRTRIGLWPERRRDRLAGSFVIEDAPARRAAGQCRAAAKSIGHAAAGRVEPGGALARAPPDGALHPQRQERRAERDSRSTRLAESRADVADRSDADHVLPRRPVAQGRSHLDDPHRRLEPQADARAHDGHGDRGARVLRPGREDDLVRPADAEEQGVLAGRRGRRRGQDDALPR